MSDPLSVLKTFYKSDRLDEIVEEDERIIFGKVTTSTSKSQLPSWPKNFKTSLRVHGSKNEYGPCDYYTVEDLLDFPMRIKLKDRKPLLRYLSGALSETKMKERIDSSTPRDMIHSFPRMERLILSNPPFPNHNPTETVVAFISWSPLLERLGLGGGTVSRDILAIHAHPRGPHCSNLRELSTDAPEAIEAFMEALEGAFSMQKLELLGGISAPELLASRGRCLRRLTSFKVCGIDDDCLRAIADHCHQLEEFEVTTKERFGDETIAYFLEKVKGSIKSLKLDIIYEESISEGSFMALGHCQLLESLSFGDRPVDIGSFGLTVICSLSNLKCLRMWPTSSNVNDVVKTFSSGKLRNLTELYMPVFDEEVIRAVVDNCPELDTFGVYTNEEDAIKYALKNCRKLVSLDISFLSGMGKYALGHVPRQLRKLFVHEEDVKELVPRFKTRHPKLLVEEGELPF